MARRSPRPLTASRGGEETARWLLGLFVLLALALFLTGGKSLLLRVGCPFQVNQGEAINVEFSRRLFSDPFLYRDPTNGPYVHAAYPPLFPLLQWLLSRFLPGTWLPGRILALAGYLGCAILFFLGGRALWGLGAAAFALLFLLSPTWAAWGSMVRIDTFMVLLEFSAFLLLTRSEDSRTLDGREFKLIGGAGFLTSLALLCKQNALLLVLAYGLACAIQKRWRRFFLFGTAALVPVLLATLGLQLLSQGYYLRETVSWVDYGYQFPLLLYYLRKSFLPECGWLLAAITGIWFWGGSRALTRCQMGLVILSLLGLGRRTSAENYFLDFVLFGLYFLAEGLWEGGVFRQKTGWNPLMPALALLTAGFACFNSRPWPGPPPADAIRMKQSSLPLYASAGEHLALDLDLPLMAGKRLWIQPAEYCALVEKGRWNPEPLLSDIRGQKFTTIELYDVPRQPLLPPAVVDEIERSYRASVTAFGRKWYVRR